jgi:hypothetical protein
MRPTGRLSTLHGAFQSRLARIRVKIGRLLDPNVAWNHADLLVSFAAIELHSAWAVFSRNFFLSLIQRPISLTGKHIGVSSAIRTNQDGLRAAIRVCKPKIILANPDGPWSPQEEPPWFSSNTITASCAAIGASNITEVRAAFSIPQTIFRDLATFRNFYGHRNENTAARATNLAARYAVPRTPHPTNLLRTRKPGSPNSILFNFFDEARIAAEIMCR